MNEPIEPLQSEMNGKEERLHPFSAIHFLPILYIIMGYDGPMSQ
jgi:hypothetical protein